MHFKTAILFLQPHLPLMQLECTVNWIFHSFFSYYCCQDRWPVPTASKHQSQDTESQWETTLSGKTRVTRLFFLHRSLEVQIGFIRWEAEQAGEEGLEKGQWLRVRRFAFGAHYFPNEVGVPTRLLKGRRHRKVKWHIASMCWMTKKHQSDMRKAITTSLHFF